MLLTARRLTTASTAMALVVGALSGCGATDGLMSSVALPATGSSSPDALHPSLVRLTGPSAKDGAPSADMAVSGFQRKYLDALTAAGVHPSSQLLALSIGSYVCQARMAGQSPQVAWDFVRPLVEGDVQRSYASRFTTGTDVDAVTRTYIRVAGEQLC